MKLPSEHRKIQPMKLSQLSTFDLSSYTNIYSLSVVQPDKIYICTSSGVLLLSNDILSNVKLPNISSQASLISICSFSTDQGIVIGVTYQNSGEKLKSNLNMYLNDKFLQTIELSFVPFELIHFYKDQHIILLSGTDKIIHTFVIDDKTWSEVSSFEYFPDLCKLPSSAIRLLVTDKYRIVGCQNSYLRVSGDGVFIEQYLDGPITSITLFDDNLVVGDGIGRVVLFESISKHKLTNGIILKDTKETVLCCQTSDFFCSDSQDILVGTYSDLFIYSKEKDQFRLKKQMKFKYPIYSLAIIDINNDGLDELLVVSMKSLVILQPQGLEDVIINLLSKSPL